MNIPLIHMLGKGDLRKGMEKLYGEERKPKVDDEPKKFWQGHDVEELLLVLVVGVFFLLLMLGTLHLALVQHPHWWDVVR